MPDILTHVLVGYILGTLLAIRFDWLTPEYITLIMLGALTPDLTKIALLLPSERIELLLGVPFDWFALHTLGGNLAVLLLGALLVAPENRKRLFLLLALGAASHHTLDLLLFNPSGYSYPVLLPLTAYNPPAGQLYLSSDRCPALVAGAIAVLLWWRQSSANQK